MFLLLLLACNRAPTVKVGDVEVNANTFSHHAPLADEVAICVKCHGEHGAGDADFGRSARWGTPDLRGLTHAYMQRQLKAFRDGQREHPEMSALARMMDDEDIERLSAYYAGRPVPGSLPDSQPHQGVDPMVHTLGGRIASQGLPDRSVPACDSCHGPRGMGIGDAFPHLAGQNADYIVHALRSIRNGARKTTESLIMKGTADTLSEAELAAVGAWYEGFLPR